MRNLLAFTMAMLLVVGGLGWYLGWFNVRTTPGADGHTTLNIDWNSLKFYQDLHKGSAKLSEMTEKKAKDAEAKADADKKAEADKAAGKDPQQVKQGGESE